MIKSLFFLILAAIATTSNALGTTTLQNHIVPSPDVDMKENIPISGSLNDSLLPSDIHSHGDTHRRTESGIRIEKVIVPLTFTVIVILSYTCNKYCCGRSEKSSEQKAMEAPQATEAPEKPDIEAR